MKKQTYTVAEAGKILGIGRGAAYEAAATGELKTVRVGRRILVPRSAIETMLGTAPAPAPVEPRESVTVDIRPALKRLLLSAAKASGRTLEEEVLFRLEVTAMAEWQGQPE